MTKDDLKSLVSEMYNNLLIQIDAQENATKEQVVEYIQDVLYVISNVDESKISSIDYTKSLMSGIYKEIADKSLSSYSHTNEKFEELTQMHEEAITECHQEQIDLPSITSKFNEIQSHMIEEVQKANKVISQLTTQVKILEETSNLDPLTKVFNRRALSSYLENVCENKNMSSESHLLILDIDDFKNINDKHGHIAGDKVLIYIANLLRKTLRDGDKIFRYGGEEFVIILNRLDDSLCNKIANRLLSLVSKNNLIYKGSSLNVTISIGATKLHADDTPDTLIARADGALYKAKANGKNQMVSEG